MAGKEVKQPEVAGSRKGYFLSLAKSIKKKIKQKILRRKRFLRVL
jgi:hypothetical protein